jgi:branched-chain amino acid transport system permease protein
MVVVLLQTYVTDLATSHGLSAAVGANIPIAAYGAVLIVIMLVFPSGLQGAIRKLTGSAPLRSSHLEKEGTHEHAEAEQTKI